MKKLCCILLIMSAVASTEAAYHHLRYRARRPVNWKTVAAGGAAAGTIITAYKVSNGLEHGIQTVAEKKPEAFGSVFTIFRWALFIGLLFACYKGYRYFNKKGN